MNILLKSLAAWFSLFILGNVIEAHRWTPETDTWNLNRNRTAENVTEYIGNWPGHQYHPSPPSWSFPWYAILPDRWSDMDPTLNNINGTRFEHDPSETSFRIGGDIAGILGKLDYLQSMGVRGLYLISSPYYGLPWIPDGSSVIDFTLLDRHLGDVEKWQELVQALHTRSMYLILNVSAANPAC